MRHRKPIFSLVQEEVGFCCFCITIRCIILQLHEGAQYESNAQTK